MRVCKHICNLYIYIFLYYYFLWHVYRFWHNKDFPIQYGGKWAVITGGSDGIGRSYALKLAERNMNVLLISRCEAKLRKVTEEIEKMHGVEG